MLSRIVIDTNVLVASLRSRRGASFRLIQLIGSGKFEFAVSVPLVLEYEAAAMRVVDATTLSRNDVEDTLDYLCSTAVNTRIAYLWRPQLPDPNDDMVLETAIAANCDIIVTFNAKDFVAAENFGIAILSPNAFLLMLGEKQ